MVVICQEEQAFRRKTREVICPAVREVARRCRVIQVKSPGEFRFQPLFSCPDSPHLLDLHEDFVQPEQLVLRLAFFRHKGADILVVRVGVRVNGRVRQCVLVNKVVDKFGEVELAWMQAVDHLKVFSVLLFQILQAAFKIPGEFQLYIQFLLPLNRQACVPKRSRLPS